MNKETDNHKTEQAAAEKHIRPEWQTRLLAEYRELNGRTRKLHLALASDPQHPDREILSEQLTAMLDYEAVLRRRVAKLGEPVMSLVPDIGTGKDEDIVFLSVGDGDIYAMKPSALPEFTYTHYPDGCDWLEVIFYQAEGLTLLPEKDEMTTLEEKLQAVKPENWNGEPLMVVCYE